MNPLKVKASGSPITSANISGLQTMTDAEVKNYIANVITEKFAAVTDGTGTAEINITTNNSGAGTSIGTFVDTTRNESIGTHPATGAVSTTTYTAKQVTAAATENITNRPLAWDSRLEEMTDGDIDDTMDLCIDAMVAESAYTAGQYKLQATAPSGGTWVARYTLTDTAQGGNTVTYLWQKTVASSAPSADFTPLKIFNGGNCKQMTEAEIEQMLPVFRNRIIETGVGTYKIQTDAPSGGTWIQAGNTFSDTREQVSPQNYAGNYAGNYVGPATYSGSRTYSGEYVGNYGGTVNYSGSRTYSGEYVGNYIGPANYAGSRTYSGNYDGSYGGTVFYSGSRNYTGNYAGNFSGNYLGTYTGFFSGSRNYAGNYAGNFSGNYLGTYTGFFAGSRNYAGNYAGNFSGNYLGTYTGFFAGSRNYAGNYAGSRTYSGNYLGPAGPSYTGFFAAEPYAATYAGLIGYAGTPYTRITYINAGDTISFFETPYFSGPGGFYSGQPYTAGSWTIDYPPGTPDLFYVREYTGLPYSAPGTSFAGTRNYAGNYAGSRNYAANYGGNYSGNYLGTYTGFFAGSRSYSGNYGGNYSGNYLGTYTGFFSGSRTYSGNYANNFSGNYGGTYTGFFSGSRTYTGEYAGGGAFTGNYSGSRNYAGNYLGTGTFAGTYSGSRNYAGNYAGGGTFSGNYSGTRNYAGIYNGSANFSGNYSGTYSGATIQASKETVSTVKLWLRTA
jgi:hypothetical protein